MFENCRPPNLLDIINRGCKPDRAGDIWRAGLEPMRRLLERALVESNAYDHFAAPVPRRHGIEDLSAPIEYADASRTTHLVSGKRQEITVQFAHIDREMAGALCSIHQRKRAHRVRFLAEFSDWIDCAQGI